MIEINIGETIRELRKNKGITQEQLAEIVGVSVPAVSKWESAQTNPDLSVLPVIARYFGVTLDFLFTFAREPSPEAVAEICSEVMMNFSTLSFAEARAEWRKHLKQYPTCYSLMYQLAAIAVLPMCQQTSEKERLSFGREILNVFEQCAKSEDLLIRQGAYYQMANIHIALDEFDQAQKIIDNIPQQVGNPQILQNVLYTQKGEHEQALKALKKVLFQSLSEMQMYLGLMISNCHQMSNDNTDFILELHEKRHRLYSLFKMESLCIGSALEIAQILAERKEFDKMKELLEKEICLCEKYPMGQNASLNNSFFDELELPSNSQKDQVLVDDMVSDALKTLAKQIFSLVDEENTEMQDLKSRLMKVLP